MKDKDFIKVFRNIAFVYALSIVPSVQKVLSFSLSSGKSEATTASLSSIGSLHVCNVKAISAAEAVVSAL